MPPRQNRALNHAEAEKVGGSHLTLAHAVVHLENALWIFARPLMLAGIFVALAWLGVFTGFYPWAHLVVLVVFTVFFCESLGKAREHWRPASISHAKRRVEEASGLTHRPLDVIEDRPMTLDSDQLHLWRTHVARARTQLRQVRWPKWKLNFSERDPYALRYALLVLLVCGALFSWGTLGSRFIAAINPTLGKQLHILNPTLDALV
jgi:hypothetical protein